MATTFYPLSLLLKKEGDITTLKELLKIGLHLIFYNRWLSDCTTVSKESQISNISYLEVKDEALQERINNCLEETVDELKATKAVTVTLLFYEKVEKKFLFSIDYKNLWEKWQFELSISNSSESLAVKEDKARDFLIKILENVVL